LAQPKESVHNPNNDTTISGVDKAFDSLAAKKRPSEQVGEGEATPMHNLSAKNQTCGAYTAFDPMDHCGKAKCK
jgi:hypothetical protein